MGRWNAVGVAFVEPVFVRTKKVGSKEDAKDGKPHPTWCACDKKFQCEHSKYTDHVGYSQILPCNVGQKCYVQSKEYHEWKHDADFKIAAPTRRRFLPRLVYPFFGHRCKLLALRSESLHQ